jgi:tripartite-type tricarboxylate transporter receptor subunit TctC
MPKLRQWSNSFVAVVALAWGLSVASAAMAGEFDILDGKNLRFVVANPPNGNNDRTARLWVKALEEKVPGLNVVVQNNPGANGTAAAIELGQVEGDTITLMSTATGPVYAQLTHTSPIAVDFTKFHWIGSMAGSQRFAVMSKPLGGKTFEELKTIGRPLLAAAGPAGSASAVENLAIAGLSGLNIKVVVGFDEEERTAMMIAGDADILLGSYDPKVRALIDSGDFHPLFQVGGSLLPEDMSNVPLLSTLVPAGDPQKLVATFESLNLMGRMITAAPATDPAVVEALRKAFDEIMADPEVVQQFAGIEMEVSPTSGADIQKRINALFGDRATVDLLFRYVECGRQISKGEPSSCSTS